MFGIGSVSKVITTAAVMQLVDQGRIGLDQPVTKYLPSFSMRSPEYRQITVRMLLNHSAGFPGSEYSNGWTTAPFPGYAKQALNTLSLSTLKTTPGALSVYCNDCFTVAGEVVAAVSGMPFTTYVARNVFAPLGMQHSTYITNRMPAVGEVARTFDGNVMRAQEVTNVHASGGVLSTPTDMGALARMFLNEGAIVATSLLSPQSVAEMGHDQMATTLMPVPDPYLVFGLGWDSVSATFLRFEGVRGWSKNGATGDYHANFVVAPDAGLAVFASAAGEQPGIDGVVEQISELLLINALREQGTIGTRSLTVTVPAIATPTQDDVNAMLGIYPATFAGSMRVTATGDPSVLQLSKLIAGTWVPLEQVAFRADGAWWPTGSTTHSWRTTMGWSRNYLYESFHSGDQVANFIVAQRVDPSGPTTKAWNQRLGVWFVVNERADSTGWRGPAILLTRIPGLSGYLDIGGSPISTQGVVGSMFLQIPTNNGRDQDDAEPIADGMLRLGHNVLRPAATVPDLLSGTNRVTIGADGYAEWFGLPKSGKVTVDGAEAWYLYDTEMDLLSSGTATSRTVAAPAGSHLVALGQPGQNVRLTLR
jgi:CubicO group peptidase (beta-lactamase class C family)